MSKPGGRGASKVGVRAMAQTLGLRSDELSKYTQQVVKLEPPKIYPPLPLEMTNELSYMLDLKQELMQRFHQSPFYHRKAGKRDIRRYTDKYAVLDKAPLEPHWDRLPAELNWNKTGVKKAAKRRKLDDEALKLKLEKLASRENQPDNEDGEQEPADDDDEEEKEENAEEDADKEAVSDEDYLEEDTDYANTYFDNGEDEDDKEEGDDDG